MIQPQTLVRIADNSGGKIAKCIKVLKKGSFSRHGYIGDLVIVSIQELRTKNKLFSKIKKGDVIRGLIVKTNNKYKRSLGLSFCFDQNAVVLLDKMNKPLATRVLGVMPMELKNYKYSKVVVLSAGII